MCRLILGFLPVVQKPRMVQMLLSTVQFNIARRRPSGVVKGDNFRLIVLPGKRRRGTPPQRMALAPQHYDYYPRW